MKMNLRILLFTLLSFFATSQLFSIENTKSKNRPKIGLVLGGGGAKGFAELGALKVIEESGLPIDYIAGTSIGSIIGAFYAMGYNADDIEQLIQRIDWLNLMNDVPKRRDIPVFERNDQDRYNFSFPIKKNGFTIPAGILEGQKISNLFTDLSLGHHDSKDFSELPTPFACVATEITTGEEVVLKKGDVIKAIRASMAIPGVFTPVEIGDMLLVDGGVINNFPVDICREMGADIIIGIDLQSDLATKEKMTSLQPMMDNLIGIMGAKKYAHNAKDCDYYIKPNLDGFTAGDFKPWAVDSMIERGIIATQEILPDLIQLRDSLGITPVKSTGRKLPDRYETFYIKEIVINGLKKYDQDFVYGKLSFKEKEVVKLKDIHRGINRIYGTGNFQKVEYRLTGEENRTLHLNLKEKATNTLNLGLHYNDVNSASLLVNATFRGNCKLGSRLSTDLKLSRNPAFSFRYNNDKGWKPALGAGFFINDNDIFIDEYLNGGKVKLKMLFTQTEINLHSLIWEELLLSGGIRTESYHFHDIINMPEEEIEDNWFFNFFIKSELNILNDANYPTNGWKAVGEWKRVVHNGFNDKRTGPLSIAYLKLKTALKLNNRFTFIPHFYARTVFNSTVSPHHQTFIGGLEQVDYLDLEIPFIGAKRMALTNNHGAVLRNDIRFQMSENNYLFLKSNIGSHTSSLSDLFQKNFIYGMGITYSYNSFLGPVEISYSSNDFSKKGYFYINIGHWF